MSSPSVDKRRALWVNRALAVGFGLAVISQARVQLLQRGSILDRAKDSKKFEGSQIEVAKRGAILARDLKPLAEDQDSYEFGVAFSSVPHVDAFFVALSKASGVPATEFMQLAASKKNYWLWSEPVGGSKAAAIESVKHDWKANGISLSRNGQRNYALGSAASGFVGSVRDGSALNGLELSQDHWLRGEDGKTIGLRDRNGEFLPMRLDPKSKPKTDGSNIVLTIDRDLQLAAAEAVSQAVKQNNADDGSAIVLDLSNGDILAMANAPSFDPKESLSFAAQGEKRSDLNSNFMLRLEPGSMFKILTLVKALDAGVVRPDEHFYCKGKMTVGKVTFGCDKSHHGGVHGDLDLESAIAESCNVSAAAWAMRVGREDFLKFVDQCGLTEKPELGLPKEVRGSYVKDEYAKTLQIALMGFGQSISVSPIGLAGAFSMIGNHGVEIKPRLIKEIGTREQPIRNVGQIVKPEAADRVLHYMEAVIQSDEGTGKKLRIPGYRLAGKTGTAQKRNPATGKMQGGGHVANFVGFVPAKKPRALILVMVDNPKNGRFYGADVAGPVFLDIAKAVIRQMDIPKTEPE